MACGSCGTRAKKVTYLHTAANGTKSTYNTETEARAAVARRGGSYTKQ